MENFIVKFGPRIKRVEVCFEEPFSFKYVLERAIRKLMESDPFMKNRASSGFFMTQYSERTKLSIEIDETTKCWEIDPNLPIELMLFESIDFEIPTRQTTEPAALPKAPAPTPMPASAQSLSYIEKLGCVVHKDPTLVAPSPVVTRVAGPSVAAPAHTFTPAEKTLNARASKATSSSKISESSSSKPSTSYPSTSRRGLSSPQPSSSKKGRTADAESGDEGEYLERVLKRRAENKAVLEELVPPDAPKLRPATRKQGKQKGKENIEPRVMPSRAAKQKVVKTNENETGNEEEFELQESEEKENSEINVGPIALHSTRKIVQINVVGNFHKKKNHREIGTVITKATPLPEFPKKLQQSLERGIYDTRQMNSFLRSHVENISKDKNGRISKQEYANLAVQVSNRFKSMSFSNADNYRAKIKKKLSDSLRAARYYPKKKAVRRAQAQKKKDNASRNQTTSEQEDDDPHDVTDEGTEEPTDEADAILQKPVVNKKSIKMCISSSTQRIPYIKTHSVEEVLLKYPYLKEADLLIYEYSSRVPLPLKNLEENFSNSLPPLAHIIDEPLPEGDDELGKIMLYHRIEKFYSGGEEHLPSIQFCEAANKNAVPLNDIPIGQAPAVVIVQDGSKILQSASLIFDGSVLTTASNPSAFDCVALLLSGYWVFEISYPAPYLQHMESFEAILHGNVTAKANTISRHSKMDEFFRKLIIASQNIA